MNVELKDSQRPTPCTGFGRGTERAELLPRGTVNGDSANSLNALRADSRPLSVHGCTAANAAAEAALSINTYIPPSRRRLSRRAEEYLRMHMEEPTSIREICGAVGGTDRTLHIAFQECYGMSPIRYSKELRLNAARKQLLQPPPGMKVTDIAMRWGFFHLGRFSQEYRRRFGECPSATLHKRASSGGIPMTAYPGATENATAQNGVAA